MAQLFSERRDIDFVLYSAGKGFGKGSGEIVINFLLEGKIAVITTGASRGMGGHFQA